MDLTDWNHRERSMVTIINYDQLCMARALIVAIADVIKATNPTTESIKQYKQVTNISLTFRRTLDQKLHTDAGVPLGPCGLDEVIYTCRSTGNLP